MRLRRANRWIVHQFYSSSAVIIAVVVFSTTINVCGSLLRHLCISGKIEIQISSSDGDLREIRSRDMNLAARDSGRLFRLFIGTVCAKRGRRFPLCPLRPFPPFSGRTPNGSDTLTSMDYFSVRRIMRLPHWRFRVEILRMNAYTCTLRVYTHYVVAITCFFSESHGHTLRVCRLSDVLFFDGNKNG